MAELLVRHRRCDAHRVRRARRLRLRRRRAPSARRADRRGAPAGPRGDRPVLGRQRGLAPRGGGALFVAFPRVLASGLSGFYLAIFLVLWCLILRGHLDRVPQPRRRPDLARGLGRGLRWRRARSCRSSSAPRSATRARRAARRRRLVRAPALHGLHAAAARRDPRLVHGARGRLRARRARHARRDVSRVEDRRRGPRPEPPGGARPDRRGRGALGRRDARDGSREPRPSRGSAEAAPRGGAGRRRRSSASRARSRFSGAGGTSPRSCPPARSWAGLSVATAVCVWPVMLRAAPGPSRSLTAANSMGDPAGLATALVWLAIGLPLVAAYYVFLFRFHRGRAAAAEEGEGY